MYMSERIPVTCQVAAMARDRSQLTTSPLARRPSTARNLSTFWAVYADWDVYTQIINAQDVLAILCSPGCHDVGWRASCRVHHAPL
jgi:hypothetical protein